MKKLLVASLVALVLALALSAGAEAKCDVTCLGHRVKSLATALTKAQKTIATQGQAINSLTQKVNAQEQKTTSQGQSISSQGSAINAQAQSIKQVSSALDCLFEVPLTEYGEPEGPFGYIFQYEDEETETLKTFPTTALDVTYEGDFVSGWALFDGCNTTEIASAASRNAIAPGGDLRTHQRPQTRLP
jgi:delta-aminolevulinic acid dehydratase/porphobilinogen synthase